MRAVIFSNGPSLNDLTSRQIATLCKVRTPMAVKQAICAAPESQYHFINNVNLADYQGIGIPRSYAVSRSCFRDIMPPDYEWHELQGKDGLVNTLDWESSLMHNRIRPWGPGIMFEIVIPMAINDGFKDIVVVGWDMSDRSHAITPEGGAAVTPDWEITKTIEASADYDRWLRGLGIRVTILSEQSSIQMERVTYLGAL
jgi:hypothetical protein